MTNPIMVPAIDDPNQKHIHWAGSDKCRYLPIYLRWGLDLASSYNYCRFSHELQDPRMWVGNCNPIPFGKVCPYNSTHKGNCVDINYYTILSAEALAEGQVPNMTQYRGNSYGNCAQIWTDDMQLIDSAFHFEANLFVFLNLKKMFENSGRLRYRTSKLIRDRYYELGYGDTYDLSGWEVDNGTIGNHHTHAHIQLED